MMTRSDGSLWGQTGSRLSIKNYATVLLPRISTICSLHERSGPAAEPQGLFRYCNFANCEILRSKTFAENLLAPTSSLGLQMEEKYNSKGPR